MTRPEGLPRVAYIVGKGHSGSTLLELLLGSHSGITSVGELKVLSKERKGKDAITQTRCPCGAPSLAECPFWQAVDRALSKGHGLELAGLDVMSREEEIFKRHNEALFAAIAEVSGGGLIVDSSKNINRLERLFDQTSVELLPIHLIRSPYGVVHSNAKRGRDWREHAHGYARNLVRTQYALRTRDHFVLRYEHLAKQPRATLTECLRWLGLDFEEAQLNWLAHEHHSAGGNAMRFGDKAEIRRDDGWKRGLTRTQKLGIGAITAPGRLHWRLCDLLAKRHREPGRIDGQTP